MHSKVKRLRRNGERKSDHDIGADPGLIGHVTVVLVENTAVMKIYAPGDDGSQQPVLPELFKARCVTMHGDKMLWQGYERISNQIDPTNLGIKQEWSLQIMQQQPAEMATRSHRPG